MNREKAIELLTQWIKEDEMLPDDKFPKEFAKGLRAPEGIVQEKSATLESNKLQIDKYTLIVYLKMKVSEEDWHGVADAAMDLRELEVKIALTSGQGKT